ncbi:MAG: lipopolysaccharide transport periplasmic protein LptA [Burkholderiales bacterium]|nr:lipopolysaccharide transport periplasmic protein LptA [Burkholderiales bacterium]
MNTKQSIRSSLHWVAVLTIVFMPAAHAEKADRSKEMVILGKTGKLDGQNVATIEGDVSIEQGTLRISAQRGEVRQNSAGQKSGFVTGTPVTVRQKREGCDAWIEAQAERVEFDESKDSLKLITKARIKTGENELTGEVILYNTVTEAFEVQGGGTRTADGRVRMVLQPRESGKDPCAKKSATPAR